MPEKKSGSRFHHLARLAWSIANPCHQIIREETIDSSCSHLPSLDMLLFSWYIVTNQLRN